MKRNKTRTIVLFLTFSLFFALSSCATEDGDEIDCPTCDNVTQLLVGTKCVPIEEVEECGPDGHSHGTECHCFSDQEPTEIGGVEYCLQQGCAGENGGDQEETEDLDQHACEHLGDDPEQVQAVSTFADFSNAHVDLETLAEIDLPENSQGFVHFPGKETGEVLVFVDTADAIDTFLDADENELIAHSHGSNTDCPDEFPEVWHVEIVNDSGSVQPQIIRFKENEAEHVHVLILESDESEDEGEAH